MCILQPHLINMAIGRCFDCMEMPMKECHSFCVHVSATALYMASCIYIMMTDFQFELPFLFPYPFPYPFLFQLYGAYKYVWGKPCWRVSAESNSIEKCDERPENSAYSIFKRTINTLMFIYLLDVAVQHFFSREDLFLAFESVAFRTGKFLSAKVFSEATFTF